MHHACEMCNDNQYPKLVIVYSIRKRCKAYKKSRKNGKVVLNFIFSKCDSKIPDSFSNLIYCKNYIKAYDIFVTAILCSQHIKMIII